MKTTEDTITVFTGRSLEGIVEDGCSHAWVLDPVRANQCRWLVCIQNRLNPDVEYADGKAPHGNAFLLGKISAIQPSTERPDRWIIVINEYAKINVDGLPHKRNPVKYASLEGLGINPSNEKLLSIPHNTAPPPAGRPSPGPPGPVVSSGVLTIAEAKKQLAAAFGIKPDAIEITIRG